MLLKLLVAWRPDPHNEFGRDVLLVDRYEHVAMHAWALALYPPLAARAWALPLLQLAQLVYWHYAADLANEQCRRNHYALMLAQLPLLWAWGLLLLAAWAPRLLLWLGVALGLALLWKLQYRALLWLSGLLLLCLPSAATASRLPAQLALLLLLAGWPAVDPRPARIPCLLRALELLAYVSMLWL
jgi:hypothetical protein